MFEKRKCRKLLKGHVERLNQFKTILENYKDLPQDPKVVLRLLVDFFNEISKFQDEGSFSTGDYVNMEKHFPDAYKELQTINDHIHNAGRCEFGWNRTAKGQIVTIDDVYLGDIYGIWTFTVRKWIYDVPESTIHMDIIDKSTNKPIWLTKLIAEKQAKPFINSHITAIKNIENVIAIASGC